MRFCQILVIEREKHEEKMMNDARLKTIMTIMMMAVSNKNESRVL